MAKQLNAEQKTISEIFVKANFLIPDYQRPYSWTADKQCETLWEDICEFAFPFDHTFKSNSDKYFLGTILTYQNSSYQSEVIDGQQRLITFLLMLRAFYAEFENIQCENKENILSSIGQCIWNTDEFHNVDKTSLKLKSEVASDEDIAEFKKILTTGEETSDNKSNYAQNYRLFKERIKKFKEDNPDSFLYLPMRILNNCILLPIDVDSQTTALRIFTTLNDRGMPLTHSDIFRAQFYKFFSSKGKQAKDDFTKRWKILRELCNRNFQPRKGTPVDDLFMRYSYYVKTKKAIEKCESVNGTFHMMREFYAENNYKLLRDEETFKDLETLAKFWDDIASRNERFSPRVLKKLYVLSHSPYSIWSYIVSLYFMSHRELEEEKFYRFLDKTTAIIWMNAILDLGKNNIRRPFLLEFKNIYLGNPLAFEQFRQEKKFFRRRLQEMRFTSGKTSLNRAMLAWWTFHGESQELPPLGTNLHVEHIYAKNRSNFEALRNPEAFEFLGNKALLEGKININASDYRFEDKKKYYLGWQPLGKNKKYQLPTFNLELREIARIHTDFTEDDIYNRNEKIFDAFIDYLRGQDLLI